MSAPVHAFGDDALGALDALSLAALVTAGERSAAELVDAAIERAERVNDRLNAVIGWDIDRARERAAGSTPTGVFAGVPTFWKGLNNVEGLPNRFGSSAVPAKPAEETSPQITQLREMGAIGLGLSAVPEFGLAATTEPIGNGTCHNPWSDAHSVGGSSGGAASLVAAGVVPIAHGNDGAGSLRIPAACAGLVGLKPSRGRTPSDPIPPVFPINPVADGIVSRTVADTAAYLHAADIGADAGLKPMERITGPGTRRLRIGVLLEGTDGVAIDSANASEVLRIAGLLEELGHQVDVVANPTPAELGDAFLVLWGIFPTVLWHTGGKLIGEGWDRDLLEPVTKWLVADFKRQLRTAPAGVPSAPALHPRVLRRLSRRRRLPDLHARSADPSPRLHGSEPARRDPDRPRPTSDPDDVGAERRRRSRNLAATGVRPRRAATRHPLLGRHRRRSDIARAGVRTRRRRTLADARRSVSLQPTTREAGGSSVHSDSPRQTRAVPASTAA